MFFPSQASRNSYVNFTAQLSCIGFIRGREEQDSRSKPGRFGDRASIGSRRRLLSPPRRGGTILLAESDGPYVDSPSSSSPLPSTQLPEGRRPDVACPTESLGTDHLDTETRPNHSLVENAFDPFLEDPEEEQCLTTNKADPNPGPGPSTTSSPAFIFLYDNITIAQILHANPKEPTNLTPARLDGYEHQVINEKHTITEDTASHVDGRLWQIADLDFWQDDWREKRLNWGYVAVEVMVSHTHFLMRRAGTVRTVVYVYRGGVGVGGS